MKLLFDQNLSPRLPRLLAGLYPDSAHIRDLGMRDSTDTEIWEYAKTNGFARLSLKIRIFRRGVCCMDILPNSSGCELGNCPVRTIEDLLRRQSVAIHTFELDPNPIPPDASLKQRCTEYHYAPTKTAPSPTHGSGWDSGAPCAALV